MKRILPLILFVSIANAEHPLTPDEIEFTIMGTGNNVTIHQVTGSAYVNQNVAGDHNTSVILQSGHGEKEINSTILGNYNNQNITQSGTVRDELNITLVGDYNSATILQTGDVSNAATVHLENVSGPSTLTLTQQGTAGQPGNEYGITQLCANPAGCAVSVTQTAQ